MYASQPPNGPQLSATFSKEEKYFSLATKSRADLEMEIQRLRAEKDELSKRFLQELSVKVNEIRQWRKRALQTQELLMIEKREKIIVHQQLSAMQTWVRVDPDRRRGNDVSVDFGILQEDKRFVPATKFSLQEEQEEKELKLKRGGNGGLGIRFAVSESGRVIVMEVMMEGSAFCQGGIKVGDEIVSVDSHTFEEGLQNRTAKEKEQAVEAVRSRILIPCSN